MVHELVHTSWNWAAQQFELRLLPDLAGKSVAIGLLVVAFACAILLYHVVEEPARKWMRGMLRGTSTASVDPLHSKLQPITGPRDERPRVLTARAG
jgi:peptidoglycan/LPS O-acetylase OafA/YrhL